MYEIIVNINGEESSLDIGQEIGFGINFVINDINDIFSRQTTITKNIKLPASDYNKKIFNNINLLSSDGLWNTNLRSPVVIKQDTIIVLTGNLQLVDYNLNDKGSYFEIICYGEFESLVKQIGDKALNKLNLSYYDHPYNIETIRDSWNKDYKSGYFYGLIDDGLGLAKLTGDPIKSIQSTTYSRYLNTKDFKCCLYIKTIFDTILAEVGYSYESTILNSLMFKNLIYYSNVKKLSKSSKNDFKTLFKVGLSADQNINNNFNFYLMGEEFPYIPISGYRYQRNYYLGDQSLDYNALDTYVPIFYPVQDIARFNNESFPNYDNYNNFDSTVFEYVNNSLDELNGRQYFHFDITTFDHYGVLVSQNKNNLEGFPRNCVVGIQVFRQIDPTTGNQHPGWSSGTGSVFPTYGGLNKYYLSVPEQNNYNRSMTYSIDQSSGIMTVDYATDFYTDYMDGRDDYHKPIQPGEKLRCVVQRIASKFDVIAPSSVSVIVKKTSYWVNEPNSNISLGQVVDISTLLDKSIKQKDFISSIVKMFNLYIEEDKINKKKLLIESRDDYYSKGRKEDWTDKIDSNKDKIYTLLSNSQTLTTTFNYKEDKDYWNNTYKTEQSKLYGEFKFTSDNQFIKGDKKIETIFSPTILANVPNTLDNPLSNINKEANNTGIVSGEVSSNPRILFKNMIAVGTTNDFFDVDVENGTQVDSTPDDFGNQVIQGAFIFGIPTQKILRLHTYPYIGHLDDPRNPNFDLNFGQTEFILYKLTNGNVTNNNLVNLYYNSLLRDLNHKNSRLIKCSMFLNSYDINNLRFNHKIYLNIDGTYQIYKLNKISNYNPNGNKSCEVELIKTIGVDYRLNSIPDIQTIYNGFDSPVGGTLPITTTQSFIPNYIKAGYDNLLDEFSVVTINYITAGRDAILGLGSQTTTNKINAGNNTIL